VCIVVCLHKVKNMSSSSSISSEIALLDDSEEEQEEEQQMILTCAIVGEYLCSQKEKAIFLC